MDYQRQQRRIGVLVVVLCLLIVVLWRMYGPVKEAYMETHEAHKRKAAIEQALKEITPPANTKITIWAAEGPHGLVALGTYWTRLDCTDVLSHYSKEFPKHGYTLHQMGDLDPQNPRLSFSAPDYNAWLKCVQSNDPVHAYSLNLFWKQSLPDAGSPSQSFPEVRR